MKKFNCLQLHAVLIAACLISNPCISEINGNDSLDNYTRPEFGVAGSSSFTYIHGHRDKWSPSVSSFQFEDETSITDIDLNGICDSVRTEYVGDLDFYTPNFIEVSGGPGCSPIEEIQAQFESATTNCEGNAYITTQAEWDQFAADYAGCTTFVGDITIDNGGAAIDSIIGVENLLKINGDVEIRGEGNPITLRAFNELDSIVGNLTVSISSNLYGFHRLKYAHDILIEDLADQSWDTGYEINGSYLRSFDSLHHCESISILNVGVIQNVLPSVIEVGNIMIEATLNAAFIGETLNNLVHADSLIIVGAYIMDNSFQQIVTVNYFEMGESPDMLRLVSNSFQSLNSAGDIYLGANEFIPTFENLTTVNNIWLEEYPADVGVDLSLLPSLTTINGNATFILCRDTIELPSLIQSRNLSIYTTKSYLTNTGAQSVSLPNLSALSGYFELGALDESDASLQSFSAPNLSAISGSISLIGPVLTSCISPAFCESVNYSPNWFVISGGPGCSSVAEIQAQCDDLCADIDLNGICDSVQTEYDGDLDFYTFEELLFFTTSFPSVNTLNGDITLHPTSDGSMFATEPLQNLIRINGKLSFDGSYHYLSGFDNLEYAEEIYAFDAIFHSQTFDSTGTETSSFSPLFDNLIECRKLVYLGASEGVFSNLEICDSLDIIACNAVYGNLNGLFNELTNINYLNINTNGYQDSSLSNFFNGEYGGVNQGGNILEALCSASIVNAFNNLDSIETLFVSNTTLANSFNNLHSIRNVYGNNFSIQQTQASIRTCRNILSNGQSDFLLLFDELQTVYYLNISSDETLKFLPRLNNAVFIDGVNSNLNVSSIEFPELDSIFFGISLFGLEPSLPYNISLNLPNLAFVNNINFSNLSITDFILSNHVDCRNLTIDNTVGLYSLEMIDMNFPSYNINGSPSDFTYIVALNCPDLSVCNSPYLCEFIADYPELCYFSNNAPGCSSIEEIQTQCLGSYASGMVYYDIDCDSEFNNDDALVTYPILLQGDTLPIGSSGETGYFFVPLELNSTVSLYAQHTADWSTTGPVIITTDSTLQVLDDIHIGLCPVNILHDVSVHLNSSMEPRPGFTMRYNIVAQNEWPVSDSVSVTLNTSLMPGATITAYAAGGTQQGATVSFATDLLYGQSQLLWVDVLVPVGTPLGTAYTATASIVLADDSADDNHPENNTYILQQTVIGSYDPNDKLVTPATIDLLDLDSTATEWLEYTIRFQNTGTAEAIFVRVLDTLSQAFDITTFELIATSDPCEVTFHDNHTIDWFFDNIMLPDSFSNEPESHGFIQFRIQTLPLSEPFILENEAAIYFDFNEPVITEPAVVRILVCAEAGELCDDGDPLTQNDVILDDCTCSGSTAIPFSISLSANRICNGSDATFYVNGIPNAQVNYALLNSYNSITLNDEGIGEINYSASGTDYTFNQDTLVLVLLSYTSADNESIVLNQYSDTIFYIPYKEPILSTYSTNLDDCITIPEQVPYLLHEVQALQNSIVYYSYNSPVQYALSANRSMFDWTLNQYPSSIENGFFNYFDWQYWGGMSVFQNNLLQDSLGYLLLESNSLVGVPENYPLEVRIDSINYGGCIVTYDNLHSMVETPSAITGLYPTQFAQCYEIQSNLIERPIFWDYPDASSYLFVNYFSTFWFPNINSTNGLYEAPTMEFEYLFNGHPIHFDLNSSLLNDTATIDNVIITASYYIDNNGVFDQVISISPLNGYFPMNDTISIQLVSYNGNDGCIINDSNAILLYENDFKNPFMEHRFILNPTTFLPSDTAFLGCNGQTQWSVPTVEVSEESGFCCSNNCLGSSPNFLTNDISTPWQSLYTYICDACSYTEDSVITISEPGIYYYILFDVDPGKVYVKPYIIESSIGTSCDDLDPCTLNDLLHADCTCAGTFADGDGDGTCDANDLCAGPEEGTVCDDNDACTINDVIQSDCTCAGTFADADGDGTCDANDLCAGPEVGTACVDNDPCTVNDLIQSDCTCVGTFADGDGDGTCDTNDLCAGPEAGTACDDNNIYTENDIILENCNCSGSLVIPFSMQTSANRICDGSNATFYVYGSPNSEVNYKLLNSLDSVILDNDGSGEISYSRQGLDYTFREDTLVLELLSYATPNQEIIPINQLSDTIFYIPYKEPVLTTYATNFNECIEFPEEFPFVLHEFQANQNSTLYFNYNTPVPYTLTANRSELDWLINFGGTNSAIGLFFDELFHYWPGNSVFQNNLLQDSLGYALLDYNALTGVPENFPLEIFIDSIDYGGCTVQYNGISSIITTPSTILGFYESIIPCNVNSDESIISPRFLDCTEANSLLLVNYMQVHEFANFSSEYGSFDIPTIEFNYLFNDQPISFELNSTHLTDSVTIDNFIITAEHTPTPSSGDIDQVISIKPHNNYFPINDTISLHFVSYSGVNGCIYNETNAFLNCTGCNNQFREYNFLLNPAVILATDTSVLSCSDQTFLEAPNIQISEDEQTRCTESCAIYGSPTFLWTSDISSPWQSSIYTLCYGCDDGQNGGLPVSEVGSYYYILSDVNSGYIYIKPYLVVSSIGSACDDNNTCTTGDVITADCTCAGTFADVDNDGTCDANDLCAGLEPGSACDDNNPCSVNDLILADCTCAGTFADADGDGTCDANDLCAGPEAGTACDDNDACTINDLIQSDCTCAGTFVDADGDGTCDANDFCEGPEAGSACDDGNACTINDMVQSDCSCSGTAVEPDFSSVSVHACEPYTWNNATYSVSGTYDVTLQNTAGCDSIAQLVLTIGSPTTSSESATACGSYTWNGTTYSQSGAYTFVSTNASGCPNTATLNLTINTLSVAPTGVMASQNSVSAGTQVTLTVQGGSLGTGAQWKWYRSACGGSLIGTGSSISITANTTDSYYVRAEGTCNTTTCASVTVIVQSAACGPQTISATATSVCSGNSTTLSVVGNTGTSGVWKWYKNGCGSGTCAGTGASLTVSPTSTTTYFVRSEGGSCGTTACLSITINVTALPSKPSSISGPTTGLCGLQNVTYTTSNCTGATSYQWTVPAGVTIVSGQGTASITVNYSNTIGNNTSCGTASICVRSGNSCGWSSYKCKELQLVPRTPSNISGSPTPCRNQVTTYSISAVSGATSYVWTVPSGSTIQSGQGTTSISVLTGSNSGSIRVRAVNSCGQSSQATRSVRPKSCNSSMPVLDLWPNPTSERVYFSYEDEMPEMLEIYDMMGRTIYTGTWLPEFDVSSLAGGIYFVRATSGGESVVKRMEIAR